MSLKIKFSYEYSKAPDGFEHSTLMEVFNVRLENLSRVFLDYDTEIDNATEHSGIDHYPLPHSGDYMVLLLRSEITLQLWTTIRRRTPDKEAHYRKNIGQVFECVVVP